MERVLAVSLDPVTREALRSHAPGWGVAVVELDGAAGPEITGDLLAVVVGDVPDPIRAAQQAHLGAPGTPVLLISTEDGCRALREGLKFAPFVGRDVQCVSRAPAAELVATLRGAVERSRRQRQHRATLGQLNARIATEPEAATRAAALLGKLMDVVPIGIAVTAPDLTVRAINVRGAELLGGADRPLIGCRLDDLLRPEDQGRMRSLLAEVEGGGARPAAAFQLEDVRRRLEITGAPLGQAAGGPGFLLVIQDVTERVELVEQLTAANRRKDEFLALLGHELRNPLAPIRTAIELMRMRGDASTERERTIIERHVNHLIQLVDDLLDISRITRGKIALTREPVAVSSFVADAVEMVSPLLEERRHALHLDVPRALRVAGDPGRLAQVVTNLLSNAARYTPPGGDIHVTARRAGDEISLAVRDNGQGIAPEMLDHVFELFVQAEQPLSRERGGLGIGLAIVRSLVELHGGRVSVSSELGRGTEIRIALPAIGDGAGDDAAPADRSGPVQEDEGAARILVVDDNVDGAVLLGDTLEALGYRIAVAHDGPSALAVARAFRPEVALLDIGLPVMDGYELADQLRRVPGLEDISLAALTGYGQESDLARSRRAGFHEHLVKPIGLDELRAATARLVARRRPPA